MKCKKCGFDNPVGSTFCQECGNKLANAPTSSNRNTASHSIHKEIEAGIDDVLFVPKKKNHTSAVIIVVLLAFVGGGLIAVFSNFGNEGANNSDDRVTNTNNSEANSTIFPTSYLTLKSIDSEWGGDYGDKFYLKGTFQNSYSELAKNVQLRVDFYRDKATTDLLDTRYITIIGVPAEGAYTFKEEVLGILLDPKIRYWYLVKIVGGER